MHSKHTLLSQALPPMTGVRDCACLSAPIVNEMLTRIQYRQIFRGRDFIADKSAILRGALHFFICQNREYTQDQTCPGLMNAEEQEVYGQ